MRALQRLGLCGLAVASGVLYAAMQGDGVGVFLLMLAVASLSTAALDP
jgi:hypothetical protein